MLLPNNYRTILDNLYDISGPIIRYRLDTEILEKNKCIEDYITVDDCNIKYWMNVHQKDIIHGKDDLCFENAISKLLDYGYNKDNIIFHNTFSYILGNYNWEKDDFLQIVIYPFLVRAGYLCNEKINTFFYKRLDRIKNTIIKYQYDFQDKRKINSKKYQNEFRFLNDWILEPLPTIYDIYAYAYYMKPSGEDKIIIENIIEYVLNDRFQLIPGNAYVYDKLKKRYYAAGSVYHACLRKERELLNVLLFSNFKSIEKYQPLMNKIQQLLKTEDEKGFYVFDKFVLKEQKNSNQVYTGAHMGLGESKKNKEQIKIESTFTMLKIISNLYRNGIELKREG